MAKPLPLALTMGEPSGIGGEIALSSWLGRNENVPAFFLIDDPERLRSLSNNLGWPVPIEEISSPAQALDFFEYALPVLPLGGRITAIPAHPSPSNAPAVIESIHRAVELALSGRVAAVVTNPIHKAALNAAGFDHPGHTEYLAALAKSPTPVMMLTSGDLRVVPVTIHIPLSKVAKQLSAETIVSQGRILARSLTRDLGIAKPRIAVAGLNPHAGEEGVLGAEETSIIRPAIATLKAEGIDIFGPLPADTLFHAEARASYDAVMCMYHDQALIPVKMLGFWEGVNVTLGLPFVRTSPDHGTALGLAGTGKADPRSLMAALRLAFRMASSHAGAA
ncbi:MAG: 4-hydroxythreonine-4-phosphate dehydrogenase PdxA [Rhodospirillales bacterium]|nr:MAG: 4-hydroxythreonine-4-phosphate dehydrogenase PdxA [Rhodospirillales bacterium]